MAAHHVYIRSGYSRIPQVFPQWPHITYISVAGIPAFPRYSRNSRTSRISTEICAKKFLEFGGSMVAKLKYALKSFWSSGEVWLQSWNMRKKSLLRAEIRSDYKRFLSSVLRVSREPVDFWIEEQYWDEKQWSRELSLLYFLLFLL